MSFNTNAFIIAGTAIAIFGVGLYLYDTRKDKVVNSYNQYRQRNNYSAIPATESISPSPNYQQGLIMKGGTKKNKKNYRKKTRKNK
jgi:hypothetical protein